MPLFGKQIPNQMHTISVATPFGGAEIVVDFNGEVKYNVSVFSTTLVFGQRHDV